MRTAVSHPISQAPGLCQPGCGTAATGVDLRHYSKHRQMLTNIGAPTLRKILCAALDAIDRLKAEQQIPIKKG